MSSLSRARSDSAIWDAYCKDVSPLRGGKVPATAPSTSDWRFVQPISIPHTLDLHGLTLAEAHSRTTNFLAAARSTYRFVTIITGRSGAIREEFPRWLDGDPGITSIEPLNGSGAFRIKFRKRKA